MIPINRKLMEKITDISLLLNNKLGKFNMIRPLKVTQSFDKIRISWHDWKKVNLASKNIVDFTIS